MSIWISIIIVGLINYLTRLGSVLLIKPKKLNSTAKIVLNYIPSAVFPAIIFPAVFLDDYGLLVEFNDPKVIATIIAFLTGILTKNLTLTIFIGLISYWIIIFF